MYHSKFFLVLFSSQSIALSTIQNFTVIIILITPQISLLNVMRYMI